MSKVLCSAYIFYKWDDADTFNSVLDKCDDGEDTIHTRVTFYTDKITLVKTDCKIFDPKKHVTEMSYGDFVVLMNNKSKIEGKLYDWEMHNE